MKIKAIPFCLLLCFGAVTSLCAQHNLIDSLQRVLPKLRDTARIDCLLQICYRYQHQNDGIAFIPGFADSAYRYCDLAMQESVQLRYVHGIAESYARRAAVKIFSEKKYVEAEELARKSIIYFDSTPDKRKINVPYFIVGASLGFQYEYEKSIPWLEAAYRWNEKIRSTDGMHFVLGFIYENFREIGDFERAFDAFRRDEELTFKLEGKVDTAHEYRILGELYKRIENYPQALDYYRLFIKSVNLSRENIWFRVSYPELFVLNGKIDSARYYYNLIDSAKLSQHDLRFYLVSLGEFCLRTQDFRAGRDYLLRALKLFREDKDVPNVNRCLVGIAEVYFYLGEIEQALFYAHESMQLSIRMRSKQYLRDIYRIFVLVYEKKKMTDSAFAYYKKYVTQKELVANDIVKGKFAAFQYDRKINSLNAEKESQQHQIAESTKQKQLLAGLLVISVLLGVVIYRNTRLKRRNEKVIREKLENELRIQKLESEKSRVELERQAADLEMQALRAQMNPHFIFNCLNSINRFILLNEKDTASDYLAKFSRLIRMVLNHSSEQSILLEEELESLRLYLDLERLRMKNAFDYKITGLNDDHGPVYIPPMLLQPFAENAIWHGLTHKEGKGLLEINLLLEKSMLICTICDNGIGREKAAFYKTKFIETRKSLGMRITGERIELLNRESAGHTHVMIEDNTDSEGKISGTRVNIRLQLNHSR